uniref:Uncharacterized protein n=1 Tax=Rhizophora mucronata TaxID=61149 RepID=A0A2P2JGM3_RHIMU
MAPTTKSPIDSKGEERDLECIKAIPPPLARRRAGFPGLLDIVIYSWSSSEIENWQKEFGFSRALLKARSKSVCMVSMVMS